MTTMPDDPSLSRLELTVLARLSVTKPPSTRELTGNVAKLALPAEAPTRVREVVSEILAALRKRALVSEKGRTLTEDGSRALRSTFGLERTPTWQEARDALLPALALGLRPGSSEAKDILRDGETLAAAVLRTHFGISKASSLRTVCDALIIEELGLPGRVTLNSIRAHMLARRAGTDPKGELAQVAARACAKILGEATGDKRSLGRGLGRRWIYYVTTSSVARPAPRTPAVQTRSPPPPTPSLPTASRTPVAAVPADMLLTLVREAIPRVGSEGRFGAEKVFVSSLWERLERDSRLPDLSLDRFKRWLVVANRDQLLDLARADLVGAMDAKLVAESEIEDLGATFHFVVDRRAGAPRSIQGLHAR